MSEKITAPSNVLSWGVMSDMITFAMMLEDQLDLYDGTPIDKSQFLKRKDLLSVGYPKSSGVPDD